MNKYEDIELGLAYYNEACDKMEEREYMEAVELVQNSLQILKNSKEVGTYAKALTLLGVIYSTLGNENMAEDIYLRGLQWTAEHHAEEYNHFFYNNLGSSFQSLNAHRSAIHYFLLAEENLKSNTYKTIEESNRRYQIVYLNLTVSYTHLEEYSLAEEYLHKLEGLILDADPDDDIEYSILLAKCILCVRTHNLSYVYDHCALLIQEMKTLLSTDFYQNINDLCYIFRSIEKIDLWYDTLVFFHDNFYDKNSVYFQMILAEKWAEYYQYTNQLQKFTEACVNHTKLYLEQQSIIQKERCDALNAKIFLQQKKEDLKIAQKKMTTDYLVNIGNRYLLKQEFSGFCSKTKELEKYLAFGIVDLDCFKQLNDRFGHLTGDRYLKLTASAIQDIISPVGNIYRYGGDEFVLLLHINSIKELQDIAATIKEQITTLSQEMHPLTLSQGYAFCTTEKKYSIKKLLDCADKALYQVKKEGRNNFHIHQL